MANQRARCASVCVCAGARAAYLSIYNFKPISAGRENEARLHQATKKGGK